jgi:hypothetical protein
MDSVSVPHATQHADLNDAVVALEAKVGADSSAVTSSHDYKIAQLEAAATGKILQVVSTTKTDTFSASISGYGETALTGLTATITPSSTTSKVLVMVNVNGSTTTGDEPVLLLRLFRDSTEIGSGDTGPGRPTVFTGALADGPTSGAMANVSGQYVDSPASTSSLTYSVYLWNRYSTSHTYVVNRQANDSTSNHPRTSSTITVMEVSA